ncbi:MAG TPA: hypothetical protein VGJ45_40135 [Pseudonocardiaceae bacterium]
MTSSTRSEWAASPFSSDPNTLLDLAVAQDPQEWAPVITPGSHLARSGFRFLHRPLLLPANTVRRFGADLRAITRLLMALPRRRYGDDITTASAAVGQDRAKRDLIDRYSARPVPAFGRVDAYHDGTGLKILEFNASSSAGGLDWASALIAAYAEQPRFAEFARTHDLHAVDVVDEVTATLRAYWSRSHPGADPARLRVALVEGAGGVEAFGDSWQRLAEQFSARGLDASLVELPDLDVSDEGVRLDGELLDVVYRLFDLGQASATPALAERARALREAHEAGAVLVWTPFEAELHRHKVWLGRLWDRTGSGLSDEEFDLVQRVLPWTVEVTSRTPAREPALWERLRDDQRNLVIKPGDGFGGVGIIFGWRVARVEWLAALDRLAETGGIVQERVPPRAELIRDPLTGETQEWDACWGLFWTPDGFGGGGARLVPRGESLAIPRARKRMTALFSYDSGAQTW